MGSSPIVSTTEVPVTCSRFLGTRVADRPACPLGAHQNRASRCRGGHGRLLAEAVEVADDVGVVAVDDVLGGDGAAPEAWPIRAVSAFRLVPLDAANVAAVCLRSWKRKPVMPTSAVAGSHTRRRKALRAPWAGRRRSRRRARRHRAGRRGDVHGERAGDDDGTPMVRRPAALLGGPNESWPLTSADLRVTARCSPTGRRRDGGARPARPIAGRKCQGGAGPLMAVLQRRGRIPGI